MTPEDKIKIDAAVKIIGCSMGIVAFIFLAIHDWKIALCLFFILWGNNASIKG